MTEEKYKLVSDILKGLDGVDPSKINLEKEDKPKRKKRKKKETSICKDEGKKRQTLKVVDILNPDEVEWGKSKKRFELKDSIDNWTRRDFVLFSKELYKKRFNKVWDLRISALSLEVAKIQDELVEIFGIAPNLLVRDYITFFFENYASHYVRKEGFYFSQMRTKTILKSFYDLYDYKKSFEEKIKAENKKNKGSKGDKENKNTLLNSKTINSSYLISTSNLVSIYGIIISINWLIIGKKVNDLAAIERVYNSCVNLHKRKLFNVVKKSTEKWSPYPNWFVFKDINSFIRRVRGRDINFKIDFSDSDIIDKSFSFIKGNCE